MTGIEALQALKDGKTVRWQYRDSFDCIEIKGKKGNEYVSGPFANSPISISEAVHNMLLAFSSYLPDSTSAVHNMLLALCANDGWEIAE